MDATLVDGVRRLAADAESGASELLPHALALLRAARAQGRTALVEVARGVCAAQPSMAPLWNAAAAALAAPEPDAPADRLEVIERHSRRSGAALRRLAIELLQGAAATGSLHVTTCSFSGTVLGTLLELGERVKLTVACAEGRPAFEGRRLAAGLAAGTVAVDFYTDAGLSVALTHTDALVVGADAIAPEWFLNKCGTRLLAASAAALGVPVYVLATRDKFVAPALAPLLSVADHDPAEIWPSSAGRVRIRNPYFEAVPLSLVSALVTDAGVLAADAAPEACRANGAGITDEIVAALGPR